ncbi:hypothetical protein GJR95_17500 [Spirosoma endbachense]|uniref:Uncharacterized protein n=1 Tax=Spirosoma endbachense TaxID=2666025 RepID=A0A6P1VUD7_9BACT|nr:hypothetical protein GJR95_17500 [Spirosoma endbachense]
MSVGPPKRRINKDRLDEGTARLPAGVLAYRSRSLRLSFTNDSGVDQEPDGQKDGFDAVG